MNNHLRTLAVALLVLASAAGVVHPASANRKPTTIDVSVDFYDPGLAGASEPMLDCAIEPDRVCSFGYDGVAEMFGTWDGSTTYRAEGTNDGATGDLNFEVWETFTGTVHGCGQGTFKWYGKGTAYTTKFDATTQTVPFSVRLWLIEGSGTGELAGITGSAAGEARFNAFVEQTGHLTGQVTCTAATSRGVDEKNRNHRGRLLARTG